MAHVTGASRARISSSGTEPVARAFGASLLVCAGLGSVSALLDTFVRMPLHLPGHRGLTGMAILVIARCLTRQSWSASATAAASAVIVAMPFAGGHPRAAMLYLLSGIVLDAACLLFATWRERVWFLALAAGLAHGSKAAALWLLGDRIAVGFGVQLASHIGFGLVGGLVAAQLWAMTQKTLR
jgi:hypothetical protein